MVACVCVCVCALASLLWNQYILHKVMKLGQSRLTLLVISSQVVSGSPTIVPPKQPCHVAEHPQLKKKHDQLTACKNWFDQHGQFNDVLFNDMLGCKSKTHHAKEQILPETGVDAKNN